jgi:hypothetical protein
MPRPGPRREYVAVRLKPEALAAVQELAQAETGDNLSEMIRKLLAEAMEARRARSTT